MQNPHHATGRLTPTESEIYTALGNWILTILPDWEVVQGQQNQTPLSLKPSVVMTIITRKRYATNGRTHNDDQTVTVTHPLLMGIQVTLFGKGSGDAVGEISTAWRDKDCVSYFRNSGLAFRPAYASDPKQNGFITAEKQYLDSWSLDLTADVLTRITKPAQSALELRAPPPRIVQ